MSVTIKFSTGADTERVRRLAELDGKRPPHGDVLLAEVNGRLLAGIGMDGTVIADPFERTAPVVKLLRAELSGRPSRARRGGGWLSRRFSRPVAAR